MGVILSREALADFLRWEPPLVGAPAAEEAEPELPPSPPTVAELEALEQAARAEGYAAGLVEGRAAARQELDERLAQLDQLLQSAARPLDVLDDLTERELARLAMVVARRVVGRELRLQPDLVVHTVRQAALALPAATRRLRVYLHADDLALLRERDAAEPSWELHADPALKRGDCRLESEQSRLDARVDVRLAAVIDAVLGDEGNDADRGADEVVA
jgi:flagellar assembly protein FliH